MGGGAQAEYIGQRYSNWCISRTKERRPPDTGDDMKKLDIGTTLYRYFPHVISPGIANYKVVGIREHVEGYHYEVECLNCKHGKNCIMLVVPDDDKLIYVRLINEDEEDRQYFWHSDRENFFFLDSNKAKIAKLESAVRLAKKEAEDAQKILENRKKQLDRLEESLDLVKELIAKQALSGE